MLVESVVVVAYFVAEREVDIAVVVVVMVVGTVVVVCKFVVVQAR